MAYTFTNGEVGTKAKLDQIVGATTQAGIVRIEPVADTPTSVTVKFPRKFPAVPTVVCTPQSTVSGTTVRRPTVTNVTTGGFTCYVYRTNTTGTYIQWQAWVAAAELFTTNAPAYATLLNQGATGLVAQVGTVNITPVANTPTSAVVTFPAAFAATPNVVTGAVTTVPGSAVLGTGVTEVEETGCRVWVTRTNTTATTVSWIALGRL